ncbi:MAG TPA: hypothetical protein VE669_08660 [Actinomycetota bacterium]|jgi:hypothetical protein|nr:hypothetical protein [Actinomycetota bacterium]
MKDFPTRMRIYRLGGRLYRVRLDRPEAGASILHLGRWVWAPMPSSSIINNPHAHELSPDELVDLPVG